MTQAPGQERERCVHIVAVEGEKKGGTKEREWCRPCHERVAMKGVVVVLLIVHLLLLLKEDGERKRKEKKREYSAPALVPRVCYLNIALHSNRE